MEGLRASLEQSRSSLTDAEAAVRQLTRQRDSEVAALNTAVAAASARLETLESASARLKACEDKLAAESAALAERSGSLDAALAQLASVRGELQAEREECGGPTPLPECDSLCVCGLSLGRHVRKCTHSFTHRHTRTPTHIHTFLNQFRTNARDTGEQHSTHSSRSASKLPNTPDMALVRCRVSSSKDSSAAFAASLS